MKHKQKIIMTVSAIVCAVALSSCGGGSVRNNEYLGAIPAIFANYEAKEEAMEAEVKERAEKVKDSEDDAEAQKLMKFAIDKQFAIKALKEKAFEEINAEIQKINGREVPVSYSKALQESDNLFYDITSAKFKASEGRTALSNIGLQIAFAATAKQDIEITDKNNTDYYIYYRFVTDKDSTLYTTLSVPTAKIYSVRGKQTLPFKTGDAFDEFYVNAVASKKYEQLADFAGVEFITKEEYETIRKIRR